MQFRNNELFVFVTSIYENDDSLGMLDWLRKQLNLS